MDRKPKDREVEALNKTANAPEKDGSERRTADMDTAASPASGAAVQRAFAGASIAAEDRAGGASETDEAIKRAAGTPGAFDRRKRKRRRLAPPFQFCPAGRLLDQLKIDSLGPAAAAIVLRFER